MFNAYVVLELLKGHYYLGQKKLIINCIFIFQQPTDITNQNKVFWTSCAVVDKCASHEKTDFGRLAKNCKDAQKDIIGMGGILNAINNYVYNCTA